MIRILPGRWTSEHAAEQLARQLGWRDEGALPAARDAPSQRSWVSEDGTALTWADDAILGLSYAVLDGPTESDAADQVRRSLDARSWQDVLQQLSAEDDWVEQVELLYQLAIAAPAEESPAVAEAVGRFVANGHPTVRRATYVAIRYLGWPDLTDHLRRAAVDDPDPEGRALAASLL